MRKFVEVYKKWSPTSRIFFWLAILGIIISILFGLIGSGDNIQGDVIEIDQLNVFDLNNLQNDSHSLFYHDSTSRYYTAEEKDYLGLTIGYSALLISLTKYEDAIKILEKAIDKNFSFYGIWINIGNAYVGLGSYDEALNSYDQAIIRNENSKLAWRNKCFLLGSLKRSEEYNECLKKVSGL